MQIVVLNQMKKTFDLRRLNFAAYIYKYLRPVRGNAINLFLIINRNILRVGRSSYKPDYSVISNHEIRYMLKYNKLSCSVDLKRLIFNKA
jgi:hypothetical protein